jgi:hypothetical protein
MLPKPTVTTLTARIGSSVGTGLEQALRSTATAITALAEKIAFWNMMDLAKGCNQGVSESFGFLLTDWLVI